MLLLTVLTLFVVGCAGHRVVLVPPNPANPIKRVAVLPMLDNSDDVDAPNRIREAFSKRLADYHYDIQPLAETDEILNFQMGITMGKQLGTVSPQEIGEKLGVDGLFYGFLLDFDEVTIGVANIYKVRMGWKLVDTKTGKISWGKGIAVRRTQSIGGVAGLGAAPEKIGAIPGSQDPMHEMPGLDRWVSMGDETVDVAQGLAEGFAGRLIGSVARNSLKYEIDFAYDRLFPDLLVGPVDKYLNK